MTNASAASAGTRPRDSLGCSLDQLDDDRTIEGRDMVFYRKRSLAGPPGRVTTPGNGRGYLIGLSLAGGHSRRVFGEHHSAIQEFGQNSIYVRNFADDYKADLKGSFDFTLLEIGYGALQRIADAADLTGVSELRSISGSPDPVLGGMLGALFASVDGHTDRSALFVDQLSVAIGVHMVRQYGNGRGDSLAGGVGSRSAARQRSANSCRPVLTAGSPWRSWPRPAICRRPLFFAPFGRPWEARRIAGCCSKGSKRPRTCCSSPPHR